MTVIAKGRTRDGVYWWIIEQPRRRWWRRLLPRRRPLWGHDGYKRVSL